MAKSRRMNQRRNRSRKAERKNRKSRKSRRGGGLLGRLYGPIHQALGFAENTVGTVTSTASGMAKQGLRGVNNIGMSLTTRANKAVGNLVSRRKSRKASRKASRKDRK
jgi:hypothetical protein